MNGSDDYCTVTRNLVQKITEEFGHQKLLQPDDVVRIMEEESPPMLNDMDPQWAARVATLAPLLFWQQSCAQLSKQCLVKMLTLFQNSTKSYTNSI